MLRPSIAASKASSQEATGPSVSFCSAVSAFQEFWGQGPRRQPVLVEFQRVAEDFDEASVECQSVRPSKMAATRAPVLAIRL